MIAPPRSRRASTLGGVSRRRRQLVLLGPAAGDPADSASTPLGRLASVLATLANFNTSCEAEPDVQQPTVRLYGPGMTMEVPTASDPLTQAIISVHDETTAWPVLERLGRATGWRLMDMESGRVMAFSA